MEIQKAEIQDLDYIINSIYNILVYEKTLNKKILPEAVVNEEFKNSVKNNIENKSYFIRVLKENGENAWLIYWKLVKNSKAWDYNLYSNLDYLFIWEKFRKKWYAEKLISEFISWAKEKWSDRMTLKWMIWNEKAYNLYQKMWFKESLFFMGKDL